MKHVLTGLAVGALALGVVSFTPDAAEAKRDRGIGIYAPGVGIEIGPRYKYSKRYYRDYGWRDRRDWRYPRAYGPRYGYQYDRRWDRRFYR